MVKTAGIVVIGNEILSGRTRDENALHLLKQLRDLGVDVRKVSVVPDELSAIRDEVRTFSSKFDFVFTSGGIGPTHDDVTIAGIAAAFKKGIRRAPELVLALERYYQDALNEAMLQMADVPEGAILIGEEEALFPVVVVENVYVFPGVPEILASKFERIKEMFRQAPYYSLEIYVQVEEVEITDILKKILQQFPGIGLGSYPSFNNVQFKVKITLESKDQSYLKSAYTCFLEQLAERDIVAVEPVTSPASEI